jgi:hypothetical protein
MRGFSRSLFSDHRLILEALVLVCAFRTALWILPFHTIRSLVAERTKPVNGQTINDLVLIKRLASSVKRTSKYVPAASCLTQALATLVLLGRYGQTGVLRIGVAKTAKGEFKAHSWVECNNQVVIGKTRSLKSYAVLSRPG